MDGTMSGQEVGDEEGDAACTCAEVENFQARGLVRLKGGDGGVERGGEEGGEVGGCGGCFPSWRESVITQLFVCCLAVLEIDNWGNCVG